MRKDPLKIVYLTPALYMAGGVERVLTLKANYLAEHCGYDITIVLTEGKGKPLFYPLSDKVKVVNLGIDFEELWNCSFLKKIAVYLSKQRRYRRELTSLLMQWHPDITVSLMRREVNFINDIPDGSKKVGELHVNRAHYRNFEGGDDNVLKSLFSKLWSRKLLSEVQRLDRLVVLTEHDRRAWPEVRHVTAIPNPLPFVPVSASTLTAKRVIAVGRYCHQKGYDLLLQAWARVAVAFPDWRLEAFGDGSTEPYEQMRSTLGIDAGCCRLNGRTNDIEREYLASSVLVCSSRFEGFGMMLIEAMACGLPVVSFDCEWGPRSIITDGHDGLLVANGQVEALSDALVRVLSDEALRRRLGSAARQSAGRYSMDVIGSKWHQFFENL